MCAGANRLRGVTWLLLGALASVYALLLTHRILGSHNQYGNHSTGCHCTRYVAFFWVLVYDPGLLA